MAFGVWMYDGCLTLLFHLGNLWFILRHTSSHLYGACTWTVLSMYQASSHCQLPLLLLLSSFHLHTYCSLQVFTFFFQVNYWIISTEEIIWVCVFFVFWWMPQINRMEMLTLRSRSTQAKDWVEGGLLLTVGYLLFSAWCILQVFSTSLL